MPGTCFKPSLPIAFRAFFSLRLWTATLEPAGMLASPSFPASTSESEELEASSFSSSAVATPLAVVGGASSSSSSILGFAILDGEESLLVDNPVNQVNQEVGNEQDCYATFDQLGEHE